MLGGYQQDHPLMLMADTGCQILGSATDGDGRPLIRRNCTGTRGVSGAPLLIEQNVKWLVAVLMSSPPSAVRPVDTLWFSTRLEGASEELGYLY